MKAKYMKTGKTLVELAQELTRRKEHSKDYVAPVQKLEAVATPNDVQLALHNGSSKLLPMSNWAHSQAATFADIPKAYYDRIRSENPALLAKNINHGMAVTGQDQKRLVRTVDNRVTALLSPRYRRLDSFELMDAVLPTLVEKGFEVQSSEVTERRTYIKAISPRITGEVKKGDVVQFGAAISNSDVGAGSLRIELFCLRLACLNGMISENSMRKAHLGKSLLGDGTDIAELLTDKTQALTDAAFFHQVRDVLIGSMKPEVFEKELNKFRLADGMKITNFDLETVVELASTHVGVTSEKSKQSMLAYLANGADGAGLTKWGLANAFTYAAQADDIDYDTATDLERAGSAIIELTPRDWTRIAEKAA